PGRTLPGPRGQATKTGGRKALQTRRERMRLKYLAAGVAAAVLVGGSLLPTTGFAQGGTFIPLLTYRTGAFANSGTPIANGMHDYFTMLNERDGGIGGSKLVFGECETGYKNEGAVECYEALKNKRQAVV